LPKSGKKRDLILIAEDKGNRKIINHSLRRSASDLAIIHNEITEDDIVDEAFTETFLEDKENYKQ
jgi:hypothetical protein